jgi:hypothetical protein
MNCKTAYICALHKPASLLIHESNIHHVFLDVKIEFVGIIQFLYHVIIEKKKMCICKI